MLLTGEMLLALEKTDKAIEVLRESLTIYKEMHKGVCMCISALFNDVNCHALLTVYGSPQLCCVVLY
mgnify:FL=1